MSFVHLRLHTEYSMVDGLVRIKPLIQAALRAKMPALAITDQNNIFGIVKFYRSACTAGIKPIIGADFLLASQEENNHFSRFTLLCQNHVGYQNLSYLLSRAYRERQVQGTPYIQWDWIKDHNEGLIVLSGGYEGNIGQALLSNNTNKSKQLLANWSKQFPDRFYLELHRTGRENEEQYLHAAVDLALVSGIPVVATNNVRFLHQDDFEAHEARICIHEGWTLNDPRRTYPCSNQQYFRTPLEMEALFSDLPEALENTIEIAKRCNLEITLGANYLPDFPIPEEAETTELFLQSEAKNGLIKRLNQLYPKQEDQRVHQDRYESRLAKELAVIEQMGFAGYFLIVADFIHWAKENKIPVGPGRGSGAGSLVAYALGITDLDPLAFDLLFERFLNPERVSLPDFDVDFCMERRDKVIDYVSQRYGQDRVSQIITYGSMAAKAVVRDVGRVLGHPYGFVDQIAKLIPFDPRMTLEKALKESEGLAARYQTEEEVRFLIDLAKKLEGITRNAGKHAGGIVIAPKKIIEYVPDYCEQGASGGVTQFDKDDLEAIGLVKFDFLGLRTLTILDWALTAINRQRSAENLPLLDLATLPRDDKKTYSLLKKCATTAIFQLESRGIKDLIKRLQPDCFEDIIALVALFRPGPLQSGMVDDYINRKHGRAKVSYFHPDLAPILKPTYGVIVYQEQVMQIAQVLAGYTLGNADLLRRAMGKKKPEEMAKQREIFITGAKSQNVDEQIATDIFDLMEKFAEYGFNKSHSAAYAFIAYQTAYLKAHYPAPYMAAVLSSDMDNTEKVVGFIEESKNMGLNILPPNINTSYYYFEAQNQTEIRYGLGAIKGVGKAALEGIIKDREQHGVYRDLFDFCSRIDLRKTNRRVLEVLIQAGALDIFGKNRATLEASLTHALSLAEQVSYNKAVGQNDLFGLNIISDKKEANSYLEIAPWDQEKQLILEKNALGYYLSGNPIDSHLSELKEITTATLRNIIGQSYLKRGRQQVVIGGLIESIRISKASQKGRNGFITLNDQSARLEVKVFAEVYNSNQKLIQPDQIVVIEGKSGWDSYTDQISVTAEHIYTLDQAREVFAKWLEINIDGTKLKRESIIELAQILTPFQQQEGCQIRISYHDNQIIVPIILGKQWYIRPTENLLSNLNLLSEIQYTKVHY
ncbi:DNA polymerase III subunit alpha [Candidatus Nitrosacidococcus tergens]|uniref:DNA polymerase III subunit alpha n=1 Tax=Candidatus Nitrosacidococcus tergens TaxID=553981 RepID=A0A7G1Q947_9GAMM|nr:DNA polymerase III subunit alpha [Candidatus Nitrosacidococcus tergens]CAB1275687.1 DNA polymerase III alpha subunit [Candidatus Nitrosacidococcus tergens]